MSRLRESGGSFDDLVGAAEQRNWYGEAERSRGLEVEEELDFCRLLDRQVGRLLALEDAARVASGQVPEPVPLVDLFSSIRIPEHQDRGGTAGRA